LIRSDWLSGVVTTARDLEPTEAAKQAAEAIVEREKRRVRDFMVDWAPRQVLAFLVSSLGLSVAAIVSSLSVLVIVGVVLLCLVSALFVVFARRLLHGERVRRRRAEVAVLRNRQEVLRLEEAFDVVTLALSGDREARGQLSRIRQPDLAQAIRALQGRRAEAEEREASPRRQIRRPAPAAPPDPKVIAMRRKARKVEQEELEAHIQALADPSDLKTTRLADQLHKQAREERKVALDAAKLARDRRARGARATARPGSEHGFDVAFGLGGTRSVEQRKIQTPEELASGGGEDDESDDD
jgi:hypothetical protein